MDAIQVSLILQRIAGDLLAKSKPASAPLKSSAYQTPWEPERRFEPAVYHPRTAAPFLLVTAFPQGIAARPNGSAKSDPCTLSETSLTLLDMNAILKPTEWTELLGLGDGGGMWGEAGTKMPEAGQLANVFLTLLKVLLTYSSLHAEVNMDAESLVRTQDTDKGDTILFTTRVWFELGDKWTILNCLRPFLNMGNLDFGNLPNNGAADGVGVSWFLTAGGVDPNANTHDMQKFQEAQDDAIVMFDNGGGFDGRTWNNVTDKNGNAATFRDALKRKT